MWFSHSISDIMIFERFKKIDNSDQNPGRDNAASQKDALYRLLWVKRGDNKCKPPDFINLSVVTILKLLHFKVRLYFYVYFIV